MCRRQQIHQLKNCKVINEESVVTQYRVLVLDWEIKYSKRRITGDTDDQTVEIKENKLKKQFKEKVLGKRRLLENVQEWWEENSMVILRAGQ